MRDGDLRAAMHAHLAHKHSSTESTLIVDEFSIDGLDRIDLATVNEAMTGYELKSESDRLDRLVRQAPSYSRVMDYLFLVTTPSHLTSARPMIPAWWGIITAKDVGDAISLRQSRKARQNPDIDPGAVARLLWRDEALAVLTQNGLDKGFRTRSRSQICDKLARELDLADLQLEVREQLKARRGWRESPARQQSGETSPSSDRIPRFLARRYQPQRY